MDSSDLPRVQALTNVELIRDGGSWAAYFTGADGRAYCLHLKVQIESRPVPGGVEAIPERPVWARTVVAKVLAGHREPVLIAIAARPPDTSTRIVSELSGAPRAVSWTEAQALLAALARAAVGATGSNLADLATMTEIAEREGRPPGGGPQVRYAFGR